MNTPDTFNYMLAGYGVLIGFPVLYAFSLYWRYRRQLRELILLEDEAQD